jgi:hypothetical protein
MNLLEAYNDVYNTQDNLLEDLVNLGLDLFFDTEDEAVYFAEQLIEDDLLGIFFEDLAEELDVDISGFLTEEVISERVGRSIVNALSSAGRAKLRLPKGTALGKTGDKLVRGAAASSTVRAARAARPAAPAAPVANRYAQALQTKRAARGLPAVGQTTAGSLKATTQRGMARHNQAVAAAQQRVSQAATVARGFMKALKQGEAQSKLARAAAGTKGSSVRIGQPGSVKAKVNVKPTTMKDPYPAKLDAPAPRPKFGNLTDTGLPDKPTKYMKLTSPKAKPAPSPQPKAAPAAAKVAPKANVMTSGSDALNKARRASAAALATASAAGSAVPLAGGDNKEKKSDPSASIGKYNTKDPDGTVRDRLKVGPKIVGPKKPAKLGTTAKAFDKEFAAQRASGAKEFEFRGKKYSTKLRGEEVDTFDIIKDHLISEGFVDSEENAVKMMAHLNEAAITKLLLKLQKVLPKLSASGQSQARKVIGKQTGVNADLGRQKMSPVYKQQSQQRAARDPGERINQSLNAAERNSSMR